MHVNEIHVLLAVVQYKTKLQVPRQGLCSSYLASLPENAVVHGWVQPGSFRFPAPVSYRFKPIPNNFFQSSSVIMVGPGTGVAPFRSYIQELAASKTATADNLLLFFGCRNRERDFYFQKEWEELTNSNKLTLVPAFSRDQQEKV